jgi:putative MATE family efflux protein
MIIIFGVQSGVGVLVAQYWGKGNKATINRILGVGMYIGVGVALVGATLLFLMPYRILGMFTNESALVSLGVPYIRIAAFSQIFNSVSMVYIACNRSMENVRLGVVVLCISSVFSVFLNWVLIFGNLGMPALGIQGAAISTLCARILEVIIVTIHANNNSRLKVKLKLLLMPGVVIFKDFIKFSLPVLINEMLWGFGFMFFPIIFGHMTGAQTILAAFTIAGNIERFFSVAIFAIGGATAVIIGREIGAGRADSVMSVAKSLTALGVLIGVGASTLLLIMQFTILEPFVYPLFDLSNEAASATSTMLLILSLGQPIRTMVFVLGLGIMRGGGDVKAFMLIDVGSLYFVALPMAALSGLVFGAGIGVVYSAFLADNIVKFTLCAFRMKSGKWINDVTREY